MHICACFIQVYKVDVYVYLEMFKHVIIHCERFFDYQLLFKIPFLLKNNP